MIEYFFSGIVTDLDGKTVELCGTTRADSIAAAYHSVIEAMKKVRPGSSCVIRRLNS